MGYWKKHDVPKLRAANPRMAKWSDAKVLRVCNRARARMIRREEKRQKRRKG